jgi:AcrR family transcriptional regulator
VPRPAGERGNSGTRGKILAAAGFHLGRQGYDRTTIRTIARSARVDPRLVVHYFGSKHDLFVAVMSLPIDPARFIADVTAAGSDGRGGARGPRVHRRLGLARGVAISWA